jgi:hypothetical protein
MDAYSSYIISISNARTGELRREAADFALSASVRRRRRARWIGVLRRLVGRRPSLPAPVPRQLPQTLASSSAPSSR